MANPVLEAAVQAVEIDAFAKDIPDLVQHDETLYGEFHKNATVVPVANVTAAGGVTRPSFRVPLRIQGGAPISQGTGNADSLGRGSGSQWVGFAVQPVFFFNVCEISFLSRIATEGRKRGLINVQAQELKNSFSQATQGLEALIQGDGSGVLDIIPAGANVSSNSGSGAQTSFITPMRNAFQFTDQQVVQVFSAVGGTNRGTATVSYADPTTQTVFFSTALPAGTVTGDYLMVNGSSGAAGNSVLGLQAWQVNGNTGTIGGLNRANYPGRLSTPTINLNGKALALSTGYRARVLLERALGKDNPAIKKGSWYCGPDQTMQMSQLYLNALFVNAPEVKGDSAPDIVQKNWPKTYAGVPVIEGLNALPGRLDLTTWSTWYIGEMLPLELYDFGGGVTVAPVPDIASGAAGSYLTSSMFVYCTCFNIVNSNPRAGVYITGAAQPTI